MVVTLAAKEASPLVKSDRSARVLPTKPPKFVAPVPVVVTKAYGVVEMLSTVLENVIGAPAKLEPEFVVSITVLLANFTALVKLTAPPAFIVPFNVTKLGAVAVKPPV